MRSGKCYTLQRSVLCVLFIKKVLEGKTKFNEKKRVILLPPFHLKYNTLFVQGVLCRTLWYTKF